MNRRNILSCIIFFVISLSLFATSYSENEIQTLYEEMNLEGKLNYQAFEQGLKGMNQVENRSNNILTVVDFSKPSNEKRLYILDMDKKEVLLSSFVSHGKGTGDLYARSFSNKEGTLKSSNGFFLTGESYDGKNGYSMRLYGLEPGRNNNAYARTLVVHAARYADESFLEKYGRLGRSKGCLAVPRKINAKIIEMIRGGSICYVHSKGLRYKTFGFLQ